MYQKRDDLLQLIKALSGNEKRYFNQLSNAFNPAKDDSLYMQLFRRYQKSESIVPKNFPGLSDKSLTLTKSRLYANILKALRLYHQDKSPGILILNQLAEVEILYNLGLADQALFALNKARKLADKHEKFGLVLQILEWESRLNVVLRKPTRTQKEIIQEEALVLRKQQQFRLLEHIYSVAEDLKKQYGFAKGDLEKEVAQVTIHAEGMPALDDCLSEKARYYYNFIYALYYWMTFGHKKAFAYSRKLVLLNAIPIPPGDYINGLLEHITSCVCLGKFDDALSGIRLGAAYIEEEKLTQSHAFTGRMFAYKSTYELIMYNYMGRRRYLALTIRQTEEALKFFGKVITDESRLVIVGNLMNAYMGIGELDKADDIWNSIMSNKELKDKRRDIFADLYLFRLFSLLHSKTYALLPSASLSALRYYRKSPDADRLFEVELPIARLLNKDQDVENREVLVGVIGAIRLHVQHFIDGLKGINNGFQEHYTRYIIWCDAIEHDEPYYEAARRWYKGYVEGI